MIEWIEGNKEWLFSGIGVAVLMGILSRWLGRSEGQAIGTNSVNITNNVGSLGGAGAGPYPETSRSDEAVRRLKDATRILFIDDDERFKVIKILRNAGWSQTSLIKDVASLDERAVSEADIFFVDIQGVGVRLGFKDEGLGLASALKDKYPEKKVVIYSAEPRGDRFHSALRKADESLEKNADPYQFQQIVERFTGLV